MNGRFLSLLVVLLWAAVASAQPAPVFNVKNYGAKGDGTTNDTVNIQKAIDAADAVNVPATVFFPRGTYMLTQVTLSSTASDITITGDGGAELKRISGLTDGQGTIKVTDADRCTIQNLVLNGNQLQGSGTNSLIHVTGTSAATEDLIVRNCLLKNVWNGTITLTTSGQIGNGLTLAGDYVWRTTLENVYVENVSGDGIRFTCNDTRIINCHIKNYRNRGFRGYPGGEDDVYPGRRVWIDQCSATGTLDIRNGGSALLIDPGRVGINEVYVTNSRFELNRTTMFGEGGTNHSAGNAAKFAHIENLYCDNCEFRVPYNYYLEAKAVRIEDCVRKAIFRNCHFKPNLFFTETGHGAITEHRPHFENAHEDTCPSQAGMTSTQIKLASGASATDDLYIGLNVYMRSGTSAGQVREITDYDGTNKIATVASAWTTQPVSSDTYSVGGGDWGTCPANGTTTTVRLAYDQASIVDDYYNGRHIQLTSGPGAGSRFAIVDYDYVDVNGNSNRDSGDTFTVTIDGEFSVSPTTSTTYSILPHGKVQLTITGDKQIIDTVNDDGTSITGVADDVQEMYIHDTGIARYNATHQIEDVISTTFADGLTAAGGSTQQEGVFPKYIQKIRTNIPFTAGTLDTDESSDGTKGFWRTVPDEVYLYNCEFGDRDRTEKNYGYDAFSGTALGGTANTIMLPGGPKGSATGGVQTGDYDLLPPLRYDLRSNVRQVYIGRSVEITGGTGSGQTRTISDYDVATGVCTVSSNWTTTPDRTSTFTINDGGTITGTAQAGSNTTVSGVSRGTITLASTASAVNDAYNGYHITAGTDLRTIIDYDGATKIATVQASWSSVPTGATSYTITIPTSKWVLAIENANSRIFEVERCKFLMGGANTAIEYAVDNDAFMHRLKLHNNEAVWSDTGSQFLIAAENSSAVLKRSGKVICYQNRLFNGYTGTAALIKTTNSIDSGVTGTSASASEIVLDGEANANVYTGKTLTIGSESRLITAWDNTTFTATVSPAFSATPSSSTAYTVADVSYADRTTLFSSRDEDGTTFAATAPPTLQSDFPLTGTAYAGGTATIFLRNDASATADYYNGCPITLTGGTGSGQVRTISDYEVLIERGTCQAGSTTTTIVLASGASATDDFYNGYRVETTGGTGANQVNTITDYVGATRTATVTTWGGATPDGTTTYRLTAQKATVSTNWATPPDSTSTYSIAANPTVGVITWAIGDTVRNSSPNNAAKHTGWVYTLAGWQQFGNKGFFTTLASDTWLTGADHNSTYRITAADLVIQLPKLSSANLGGTRYTFIMTTSGLSTGTGLRIRPFQDTTSGGTSVGEFIVLAGGSNSKSDSLVLAGSGDRDGDQVTLVAGLDTWYIESSVGTWTKYDEIEP